MYKVKLYQKIVASRPPTPDHFITPKQQDTPESLRKISSKSNLYGYGGEKLEFPVEYGHMPPSAQGQSVFGPDDDGPWELVPIKKNQANSPDKVSHNFSPQKDIQVAKASLPKIIRLQIPVTMEAILIPRGSKIFPITSNMTGDVGHLIAYGFLYLEAHFLVLNPITSSSSRAPQKRIPSEVEKELSFFLGTSRIHVKEVSDPHALYSELTSFIEKTPKHSSFYRVGKATQGIGESEACTQLHFKKKLEPIYRRYSTRLNQFLYATLGINSSPDIPKYFIWGRNSGHKSGVHAESDSTGAFLKALYRLAAENHGDENKFQAIFVGGKLRTQTDKAAFRSGLYSTSSRPIFEFWDTPAFKDLNSVISIPSGVLQLLLFYALEKAGHRVIHLGNRSGTIDKLAFALSKELNRFVEFIPENFENGRLAPIGDTYISRAHILTPASPKGRFLDCLFEWGETVREQYGVDTKGLNNSLKGNYDQERILFQFERLNLSKKSSESNKLKETFKREVLTPILSDLSNESLTRSAETDSGSVPLKGSSILYRDFTGESLEKIRQSLAPVFSSWKA